MRWNAALGPVAQVGGVVGERRPRLHQHAAGRLGPPERRPAWQATLPGVNLGGPAVSPDGQTVYVGGINAAGTTGMVAALSTATGAVLWQVELEDAIMSPLDRLWIEDGLLGWRLWETVGEVAGWLADGPLDLQLLALAGGLGTLVLVGLVWLAVRALAPPTDTLPDRDTIESTATRLALPVVFSYTVTLAVVVVLSGLALATMVVGLFVRSLVPLQELILQVIG